MRTPPAGPTERQLALLWLAAAVSAVALRPLWLFLAPYSGRCVFRSMTGVACPSCGTTRAAVAFLEGDLSAAFAANPLAAAAGLLLVVGAPFAVIWTFAKWPIPMPADRTPIRIRIAIIVVVLANWFYVITTT